MTVIVEKAVVAVIRIEAPSQEAAQAAFDDLVQRVYWSLPKLRLGPVRVLDKQVTLRTVSIRGAIGKEGAK